MDLRLKMNLSLLMFFEKKNIYKVDRIVVFYKELFKRCICNLNFVVFVDDVVFERILFSIFINKKNCCFYGIMLIIVINSLRMNKYVFKRRCLVVFFFLS